jgi:hypothetical protein
MLDKRWDGMYIRSGHGVVEEPRFIVGFTARTVPTLIDISHNTNMSPGIKTQSLTTTTTTTKSKVKLSP